MQLGARQRSAEGSVRGTRGSAKVSVSRSRQTGGGLARRLGLPGAASCPSCVLPGRRPWPAAAQCPEKSFPVTSESESVAGNSSVFSKQETRKRKRGSRKHPVKTPQKGGNALRRASRWQLDALAAGRHVAREAFCLLFSRSRAEGWRRFETAGERRRWAERSLVRGTGASGRSIPPRGETQRGRAQLVGQACAHQPRGAHAGPGAARTTRQQASLLDVDGSASGARRTRATPQPCVDGVCSLCWVPRARNDLGWGLSVDGLRRLCREEGETRDM